MLQIGTLLSEKVSHRKSYLYSMKSVTDGSERKILFISELDKK